ncbi:hypothetical protein HU200_006018 [Digitaria exilis]|uniref:SIAH-type domain-containing protein n=1 Tax=Digitaria exilis TaxID=1010633 RepID=A0A835FS53_9POAL|nr:hypothetical protein HU200_006018 [Digitaria exilis]CAB3476484.1 unnamed protein product [Digitaria exilis]
MEAAEAAPTSEPPPTEGARRSGKRARDEGPLLTTEHKTKLVQAGAEAAAAQEPEATVPSESPAARPPAAVRVDMARLYCSLCSSLLKPPIYQVRIKHPPRRRRRCAVGHVACCRCRVKLPDSGCRTCGAAAASAYKHCPGLDLFFGDLRVPCRYAEYGCESFVPYFRSDEHRDACGHAPCHCPEPGCYLVSSPRDLAAHLAGDHSWPADEISYGTPRMLAIPMPPPPPVSSSSPAPARHLRLLRGEEDASVFVVAVGTLGDGAAMSVVLVRANSPAHPRYVCTFCVKPPPAAEGLEGDGDCCFFGSVPVRSSALADDDGVAPEKEVYFAVPGEMLCEGGGGGGRELVVSVRIDRSCGPEPPQEDYGTVIQN